MRLLTSTLILPALLLAFSSCRTYQYFTLDSPEVPKNNKGELHWENDTLRLEYGYAGEGGPVWMSIHNKTDKPLYINWKKSAFIENGNATSLYNSKIQVAGSFDATRGWTSTSGNIASSFTLPDGMDFIPPGSRIGKDLNVIVKSSPVSNEKLSGVPQRLKTGTYAGAGSYTMYSFDPAASPLQFKSYLTFVLGDNNATEFAVRHSFYAQSVIVSSQPPQYFKLYGQGKDMLYVKGR